MKWPRDWTTPTWPVPRGRSGNSTPRQPDGCYARQNRRGQHRRAGGLALADPLYSIHWPMFYSQPPRFRLMSFAHQILMPHVWPAARSPGEVRRDHHGPYQRQLRRLGYRASRSRTEGQGEIGREIGRGDMKPSLDLDRVTRDIRAQRTAGTTITPSLR
jgi:hypothetical protein